MRRLGNGAEKRRGRTRTRSSKWKGILRLLIILGEVIWRMMGSLMMLEFFISLIIINLKMSIN